MLVILKKQRMFLLLLAISEFDHCFEKYPTVTKHMLHRKKRGREYCFDIECLSVFLIINESGITLSFRFIFHGPEIIEILEMGQVLQVHSSKELFIYFFLNKS